MVYQQWFYCSKDFSAKKLAELEFWPIQWWFSLTSFKLHSPMIKETVESQQLTLNGSLLQQVTLQGVRWTMWCSDTCFSVSEIIRVTKPFQSWVAVNDWRWINSFCLSEHVWTETIFWQWQKMKKILNLNYRNLPKIKKNQSHSLTHCVWFIMS